MTMPRLGLLNCDNWMPLIQASRLFTMPQKSA